MNFPEGTIFLVSSMASAGVCISDMRTFHDEKEAWKYFRGLSKYGRRCWATCPEKAPLLISTKSYMRAHGIDE